MASTGEGGERGSGHDCLLWTVKEVGGLNDGHLARAGALPYLGARMSWSGHVMADGVFPAMVRPLILFGTSTSGVVAAGEWQELAAGIS